MKKLRFRLVSNCALLLCLTLLAFPVNAQREIDPTRFESAIEAFEAKDRMLKPPVGAIVLTGR